MFLPANFNVDWLVSFLVAKNTWLSLQYGWAEETPYVLIWFGMILVDRDVARYREGFEFGRAGFELVEKHNLHTLRVKARLFAGDITHFYGRHLKEDRAFLEEALVIGQENGDLIHTCYTCNHIVTNMLAVGDPLLEIEERAEELLSLVRKIGDKDIEKILISQIAFVKSMLGKTMSTSSLDRDDFSQEMFEREIQTSQMTLMKLWYFLWKMAAFVHHQEWNLAHKAFEDGLQFVQGDPWNMEQTLFYFYGGVASARMLSVVDVENRDKILKRLDVCLKYLRGWAEACPENFANRLALVEAEVCRAKGESELAVGHYHRAIELSDKFGFVHQEALAWGLSAKFFAEQGDIALVRVYQEIAERRYEKWGAQCFSRFALIAGKESGIAFSNKRRERENVIEFDALVRAQREISSEIHLEQLSKTLLKIIAALAGADAGWMFMERNNSPVLAASYQEESANFEFSLPRETSLPDEFPLGVVNYVWNTREVFVLSSSHSSVGEDYFRTHDIESAVCLPVVQQNKVLAAIYLENHELTNIFSDVNIRALEILAAQVAVSLRNAYMYEELEREKSKAEEANMAKSVFLANMGHEIRTPLTAIVGASEILLHTSSETKDMWLIETLHRSAFGLQDLVEAILGFASAESVGVRLEYQNFSLHSMVRELMGIMRHHADAKLLAIDFVVDPKLPPEVRGDSVRLRQVLSNLISNAMKFTHAGFVQLSVSEIAREGSRATVSFVVADSGVGIAPGELASIFEPFQQGDSSTTKRYRGVGLGLALVKNFVTAMGGRVEVQSVLGEGSTFTVTIPFDIP